MTNDSYPLLAGGELVRNERALLSRVECGSMMTSARAVRFIVLHCSATRCDRAYSVRQLRNDHLKRGFKDIGYHFYVRRDTHAASYAAGSGGARTAVQPLFDRHLL